jgi:hypothetical protein
MVREPFVVEVHDPTVRCDVAASRKDMNPGPAPAMARPHFPAGKPGGEGTHCALQTRCVTLHPGIGLLRVLEVLRALALLQVGIERAAEGELLFSEVGRPALARGIRPQNPARAIKGRQLPSQRDYTTRVQRGSRRARVPMLGPLDREATRVGHGCSVSG